MSETPTGTDRVELTDAERASLNCDCVKYDGSHYDTCFVPAVESLVAARVQALPAELDELDRQAVAEHDRAEGWRKKQVEAVGEVRRLLGVTNEYMAERDDARAEVKELWSRIDKDMQAEAEVTALQATLDRVTALADEWDENGINCECGHSIGGEHNGLGCYARLSYDPLVTCECKLTDDQFESDVAVRDLRAALTPEGKP